MIPDLRQLRYFVAVAEELHFSRAARRLHLAQPPLSQQINELERKLGVQLFVRTTRRVELTPAGSAFLVGARRALAEAERAVEVAQRAGRGEFETLRISFADAAAVSVLAPAVRSFRKAFPNVGLDLREDAGAADQFDAVRRDLVDVALARGPLVDPALCVEVLLEEPFCIAIWNSHPLARHAKIPLELLAEVPFVFFPRRLSPVYYDLLMGMCQSAGFTPHVAYELEKLHSTRSMVEAEVGVAFVPRSVGQLWRADLAIRELTGATASAQVVAAYRPSRSSVALEGLLAALREPVA
jgi:DNA-binding transcriptional LysR family regulator